MSLCESQIRCPNSIAHIINFYEKSLYLNSWLSDCVNLFVLVSRDVVGWACVSSRLVEAETDTVGWRHALASATRCKWHWVTHPLVHSALVCTMSANLLNRESQENRVNQRGLVARGTAFKCTTDEIAQSVLNVRLHKTSDTFPTSSSRNFIFHHQTLIH